MDTDCCIDILYTQIDQLIINAVQIAVLFAGTVIEIIQQLQLLILFQRLEKQILTGKQIQNVIQFTHAFIHVINIR